MERPTRDNKENGLQWQPSMAAAAAAAAASATAAFDDSLLMSPNHHLLPHHQNSISQGRLNQNPSLQYRLYQNPTSQNHHSVNYLFPSDSYGRLPYDHTFGYPSTSLDDAFSRISLSSPYHHPPHHHSSSLHDGFAANVPYSQEPILNRIRSLGMAPARSNPIASSVDRRFRSFENGGGPNMVVANQSFSNSGSSNGVNFRRRSQSYNGLGHGMRLDSGSQFSKSTRSINGLDSTDSNILQALCNPEGCELSQHGNYSSLEQVKGKISLVAKDQYGCRFLQKKLEENDSEQTEMIFSEIKEHLFELMVDQFGNYLIQKLLELCDEEQINQLLISLINNQGRVMEICVHTHGTRAMQKLIWHVKSAEQRSLIVSVLKRNTVPLSMNQNGHHVIQQCLNYFPVDSAQYLMEEIAENCLDIAMDKSGCCVLQLSVVKAPVELKQRFVKEITDNALLLAEHPYGNYVVQHILGLDLPHAKANILKQLEGNCIFLSKNKYGSNVVEKCLRETGDEDASRIIKELMFDSEFLSVLQDPYGNYVAQTALLVAKGDLSETFIKLIQMNYPFLHSHLHGKKVLARTRGFRQRV